jgi:hypothetical protein
MDSEAIKLNLHRQIYLINFRDEDGVMGVRVISFLNHGLAFRDVLRYGCISAAG